MFPIDIFSDKIKYIGIGLVGLVIGIVLYVFITLLYDMFTGIFNIESDEQKIVRLDLNVKTLEQGIKDIKKEKDMDSNVSKTKYSITTELNKKKDDLTSLTESIIIELSKPVKDVKVISKKEVPIKKLNNPTNIVVDKPPDKIEVKESVIIDKQVYKDTGRRNYDLMYDMYKQIEEL